MVRTTGLPKLLRCVFTCGLVYGLVYGLVCGLAGSPVLTSGFARAQSLPLIKLSDLSLSAGDPLTVTASGLVPETVYTLTLTNGPDEAAPGLQAENIVEDVQADAQGGLSYTTRLSTPGRWQLTVRGDTLNARFEVEVTSREETPAVTPAPPDGAAPAETGPAETGPAESDPPGSDTTETDPNAPSLNEPGLNETVPADAPPADTPSARAATPSPMPAPTPDETAPQEDSQPGATLERTPLTPTPPAPTSPRPDDTEPGNVEPDDVEPGNVEPENTLPTEEPATSPGAPAPSAQPSTPYEVGLEDGAVVARDGDEILWTLTFPPESGETSGLLTRSDVVYVGHGNSLLTLDLATGVVQDRLALPSQVTGLSPAADGLTVTTETETVTFSSGTLEPVVFDPASALFGWLRAEAQGEDPAARLAQDPTNPWLYLRVGQTLNAPESTRDAFAAAVERAETFYDAAGLSRALLELGEPDLANLAADKALRDFAARGYDPRLLRDLTLHEAYNFPLQPFQEALAAEDLERAGFWAPWLAYFAAPEVPAVGRALRDYADLLRQNGQGLEANRWRDLGRGRLMLAPPAAAARFLGRSGWYSALALLATVLALHFTLAAKYWRAQSVNFERRRLLNRSVSPVSRIFIMRFYSLTEKVVLLMLLAGALLMAGLASGYRGTDDVAALGSGTFASAAAQSYADAPLAGTRGDFVRGYAAQVAGDEDRARTRYDAAEDFAPALNNLGALTGDDTFYRRAAELSRLPEARYNLGEDTTDLFAFQRAYRPGTPLLAVPSSQDLQVARAGDWSGAVAGVFVNPWSGLMAARPAGLATTLWAPLVVLFLVLVAVTFVWLFVPRLRWVRNAPRTWAYHVLALLVPGSGLADEVWGLLLLVPWALVGLDTLSHLYAWNIGVGLSLRTDLVALAVIYLVNTVAVAVEFWSYRRRMTALKRDNPELALEFGLIRPARVRR